MVGKDANILGQLANIGSSKLEANRCQYLEQDVWTFWKQESPSLHSLPGRIGNFLLPLNFVSYLNIIPTHCSYIWQIASFSGELGHHEVNSTRIS